MHGPSNLSIYIYHNIRHPRLSLPVPPYLPFIDSFRTFLNLTIDSPQELVLIFLSFLPPSPDLNSDLFSRSQLGIS